KELVWVIYGGDSVKIIKSNDDDDTVILEFIGNPWKYKSFMSYENVYLDINDMIYSITPKMVNSGMITVKSPITKHIFCEKMKGNDLISIEPTHQTTLYVKQQGAGNGKTYGIVQLIQ